MSHTPCACDVQRCPLHSSALELLEALKALRSFMWKEGYTDTTLAMVKADVAIHNATGGAE